MEIMRIGLDLAKSVFEVFGIDEQEQRVLRKTLKRNQVMEFFALLNPCIVGIAQQEFGLVRVGSSLEVNTWHVDALVKAYKATQAPEVL